MKLTLVRASGRPPGWSSTSRTLSNVTPPLESAPTCSTCPVPAIVPAMFGLPVKAPWANTFDVSVSTPPPFHCRSWKWELPGTIPGVAKLTVGAALASTVLWLPEGWKASALVVASWVRFPTTVRVPADMKVSSLPPSKTALPPTVSWSAGLVITTSPVAVVAKVRVTLRVCPARLRVPPATLTAPTPVVALRAGALVVAGITTLSVALGTELVLQFPATLQSVEVAPVQVGAPVGVAVAVKVTAASAPAWTVYCTGPLALAGSVANVCAFPPASVKLVAGWTEPPAGGVNVTGTPGTPRLSLAVTWITRGRARAAPGSPVWLSPLTRATAVGMGTRLTVVLSTMPCGKS